MTSETARKIGAAIGRILMAITIAVAAGFAFDLTLWQVVVVGFALNFDPGAIQRSRE